MKLKGISAFAAALALTVAMASCAGKDNSSEKARDDYQQSLRDSVAQITAEIDSCNSQISIMRDQVEGWLRDFTTVANPREVGSYTILTSWKNRYPLSSTGLVARIDENGRFELVAALSGGRAFDRITVQTPEGSASTHVVPNDQALNYRSATLTTVLFSGEAADSVGNLIANNELNDMTVIFEQDRPVQSWKMPGDNAKMISYTYLLYKSTSDMRRLERRVPMLHEKVNLLRLHIDKNSTDSAAVATSVPK